MCRLEEVSFNVSLHTRSPAVLTAPALTGTGGEISQHRPQTTSTYVFCKNNHFLTHLLPSMTGASTDGTQVFLLPLVSNLVHFAIVVAG